MENCRLMLNGAQVGLLSWQRVKEGYHFECMCPYESGVIYRVMISKQGKNCPLGVMMPKGGNFVLFKTLSGAKAAEFLPPDYAKVYRSLPGESAISGVDFSVSHLKPLGEGMFITDIALRKAAIKQQALYSVEDEGFTIMAPIIYGKESALAPFFCLANIMTDNESAYLSFKLDKDGVLILPLQKNI